MRPAILATVLLAMVGGGLVACTGSGSEEGDQDAAAADPTGEQTSWEFTDDRGITHTSDATPDTIAAQSVVAGGLWEYGIVADGVFGPLTRPDGSPDPAIGLADPDDFTSLGEVDSEINLEALAALRPDFIVTAMWGEDTYWGIEDDQADEIEQIAPIIGIRVDDRSIEDPLARLAELAVSLGADPEGELATARSAFDTASADLEQALADKPGLVVAAVSGTPTEMYVADPQRFPELVYYQALGMDLVEPENPATQDGFWETLSWEQAGKYPADLVLGDARGGTVDQMKELLPASAMSLPAIEADQLVPWPTVQSYGYGNVARNVAALADEVDSASADIV